jgi:hypothetical protein
MTIGIYFRPASMSADQYDDIIKRLETAGSGTPAGRLYHVCFGADDSFKFSISGNPSKPLTISVRP